MTENSGLLNRRFAANFIPLPPLQVPSMGSIAPDFSLPTIGESNDIKLSSYRGQKPVVLAFTRIFTEKLFCPYCYPHVQDLKQRYQEFKDRDAELLMITSTDPVQSQQIVEELSLPYPFLYDPECLIFTRKHGGRRSIAGTAQHSTPISTKEIDFFLFSTKKNRLQFYKRNPCKNFQNRLQFSKEIPLKKIAFNL
ncbi:MAG: peroxiredoxin family protein [Cyanobacteria bacterium J06558_2]